MSDQRIIAVGLLTARDLEVLGQEFTRIFPIDEKPCFAQLLSAIDEADRQLQESAGERSWIPDQVLDDGLGAEARPTPK